MILSTTLVNAHGIHLIIHATHNFDDPIQLSWQNAPHFWHITIAFNEHAQFDGVFSTLNA